MSNELATMSTNAFIAPVATLEQAKERYELFKKFVSSILVKGQDYGEVPGTDKPTLKKPGAEKLATFFGLHPAFIPLQSENDWTGKDHNSEPFFFREYKCQLTRNGDLVGEGIGSCNSWEKKYRYRWVNEMDLPAGFDTSKYDHKDGSISEFAFAIEKGETSGKYGKPTEYWQKFRDAITNGTAREFDKKSKDKTYKAYEIGGKVYAIPNKDVADQVNTIDKMAQKRAFVAAVLLATNASDYFTQDMEDFSDHEPAEPANVVEGHFTEALETEKKEASRAPEQITPTAYYTRAKDLGISTADAKKLLEHEGGDFDAAYPKLG